MHRLKVMLAALMLLPTVELACAAPSQRVISFQVDGQKVVGTLELPEGVATPPVVLLLHGFKGSRDEMKTPMVKEGIFARAADAWAAKGLASLRIDFRGGGDSDGSFEDTTISGQIKDALAAIDFLQGEKSVDAARLTVVGWSQGGAVAAAVAGRTTHPLKAVAFWNPLVVPAATFQTFAGPEAVAAGLASGSDKAIDLKMPWGGTVALKAAYFKDLYTVDPVAELAKYPGPAFVAVGTTDTIVFPEPATGQLLLSYHKGPGELWVRPMDHGFNAFVNADTLDELIAATGAFLEKNSK